MNDIMRKASPEQPDYPISKILASCRFKALTVFHVKLIALLSLEFCKTWKKGKEAKDEGKDGGSSCPVSRTCETQDVPVSPRQAVTQLLLLLQASLSPDGCCVMIGRVKRDVGWTTCMCAVATAMITRWWSVMHAAQSSSTKTQQHNTGKGRGVMKEKRYIFFYDCTALFTSEIHTLVYYIK